MRSYRYKRRRAQDPIVTHDIGHQRMWGGWYPLRLPNTRRVYYKTKHYEWWSTVHRWGYRFVSQYDKENYVFSNMEYTKWRRARPYEMWNCNHDY